jgi:hypothetical protein
MTHDACGEQVVVPGQDAPLNVYITLEALRCDFRQLQKLMGKGKIGGRWGCGRTTIKGSREGVHKMLYQYHFRCSVRS